MRPKLPEIADQRALAMKLLAENPRHELAPLLKVFLGATAPITEAAAITIMIRHANTAGGWASDLDDEQRAMDALSVEDPDELDGSWQGSIWAQWATLRHFFGGAS